MQSARLQLRKNASKDLFRLTWSWWEKARCGTRATERPRRVQEIMDLDYVAMRFGKGAQGQCVGDTCPAAWLWVQALSLPDSELRPSTNRLGP